jgi:hypothetical protein
VEIVVVDIGRALHKLVHSSKQEQTEHCKNVLALLRQSDHTQAGSGCKEKKRQKPLFSGCFSLKSKKRAREMGFAIVSLRGTPVFGLVHRRFSDRHKLLW